ncbi:MAG: hypothetical protein RJA70_1779 [Pseudomonadota bacterium]|jgi:prepilin-type N-terminal cleavage/methylation domain-containing protein
MTLRRRARGFTLVELMVVVVIMGVMAAISLQVFSQQVSSSKGIEALSMVQSIRAAQERHRAMHTVYLSVSENGWYPRDPSAGGVGRQRRSFYHPAADDSHGDNPRWWQLKPTVSGAVYFGYQTNAGVPGSPMTAPLVAVDGLTWPATTEPWYVIQCIADADGNGQIGYYLASSVNNEVYRMNEGE